MRGFPWRLNANVGARYYLVEGCAHACACVRQKPGKEISREPEGEKRETQHVALRESRERKRGCFWGKSAGWNEVWICDQTKCLLFFITTVFKETGLYVHFLINGIAPKKYLTPSSNSLSHGNNSQDPKYWLTSQAKQ